MSRPVAPAGTWAGPLGVEWIVEASGCEPARLRDEMTARAFLEQVVEGMELHLAAPPLVHLFDGAEGGGGLTAMLLLTESHVTLHTFPEHGALALNVYCCRERTAVPWGALLAESFGASDVAVRVLARGVGATAPQHTRSATAPQVGTERSP